MHPLTSKNWSRVRPFSVSTCPALIRSSNSCRLRWERYERAVETPSAHAQGASDHARDVPAPQAPGKRTLATRIGRQRTLVLLALLVCAAFTIPIVVLATHLAGVTVMLVHFAIPIAAVPVRTAFAARTGPALVGALKRMAVAQLAYALLFTLGLLI